VTPLFTPHRLLRHREFGGYDKLEKLYTLKPVTVLKGVDVAISIISEIHRYLDESGELPAWMPDRRADGRFVLRQ
jgi:hypothetical protein